jgi:hypothetical protein
MPRDEEPLNKYITCLDGRMSRTRRCFTLTSSRSTTSVCFSAVDTIVDRSLAVKKVELQGPIKKKQHFLMNKRYLL